MCTSAAPSCAASTSVAASVTVIFYIIENVRELKGLDLGEDSLIV